MICKSQKPIFYSQQLSLNLMEASNKSQWQLNAGKVSGTNRRGHFETYQNDK